MITCPECNGDKYITITLYHRQSFSRDIGYEEDGRREECPDCQGEGQIKGDTDDQE